MIWCFALKTVEHFDKLLIGLGEEKNPSATIHNETLPNQHIDSFPANKNEYQDQLDDCVRQQSSSFLAISHG